MSRTTLNTSVKLDKTVFAVVLLTEDNWVEWKNAVKLELMFAGVSKWIHQKPPCSLLALEEMAPLESIGSIVVIKSDKSAEKDEQSTSSTRAGTVFKAADTKDSEQAPKKDVLDEKSFKEIILACRIIVSSVGKSMLKYIQHVMDDPYEMWETLRSHFELRSSSTVQSLKLELMNLRKLKGESIDAYAARIEGLANRITQIQIGGTG